MVVTKGRFEPVTRSNPEQNTGAFKWGKRSRLWSVRD